MTDKRRTHFLADSPELKAKTAALYERLGFTMTQAFNQFMRASLKAKGFPFEVNRKDRK